MGQTNRRREAVSAIRGPRSLLRQLPPSSHASSGAGRGCMAGRTLNRGLIGTRPTTVSSMPGAPLFTSNHLTEEPRASDRCLSAMSLPPTDMTEPRISRLSTAAPCASSIRERRTPLLSMPASAKRPPGMEPESARAPDVGRRAVLIILGYARRGSEQPRDRSCLGAVSSLARSCLSSEVPFCSDARREGLVG